MTLVSEPAPRHALADPPPEAEPSGAGDAPWRPVVSITVAMLDEERHIESCLRSFARQSYPTELLDVIVVDGGSTDRSREIVEAFAVEHPWVRLVDNPHRAAPFAWNIGLAAARGEVFGIFSSHGVPAVDFVERSVAVLAETGVAGVGGRYVHRGLDGRSTAIGLAMASPVGMASPHRSATHRAEVDTISHPMYRTEAVRSVGGFDERLLRNEDYELNWRLRDAGERLLFDPSIASVYRPRPSLGALARQFWWYGRFKADVLVEHPRSAKVRHLVPPAFAALVAASPLLAAHRATRRPLLAVAAAYVGLVLAGTRATRPAEHHASPTVVARAFPVMHLSWGAGVWAGLAARLRRGARGG